MPKAVGRANQRKRKVKNQPTEENLASSGESNVKLLKVLRGELSNSHLDDCNNDFAESKSSRAPARKKRKPDLGGEEIVVEGVSSLVNNSSVAEKKDVGEDEEQYSQGKQRKQRARTSPRKKGKCPGNVGSSKNETVPKVEDGANISEQETKKGTKGSGRAKDENEEAESVSIKEVRKNKGKEIEFSQGEKNKSKNHRGWSNDSTGDPAGEELVPCPCCGKTATEIFPDGHGDMNNHALVCLHQKFGSSAGESSNPGSSVRKDFNVLEEKKEVTRCQICNSVIDHMSARQRTEHVNRCIDNATQPYANGTGSAKQASHLGNKEMTTTDEEDEIFCQICHKNISHMNSRRRTQHVNRCIDSNFEELKTSTPSSQDQPQPEPDVPSCIICGTLLNTHQKRKSHLKKCARENNISTSQLLDMVKKQELSSRDKQASKEKPLDGQPQQIIRPTESVTSRPATKPRKPRKKKKDDLDEDVQVAMAISASIAEGQEKEKRILGITNENLEDVQDTIAYKGGGTKKKRGRPAKHKPLNFPVLLTRTSPENRKLWSEKIGAIVDASSQQKLDVGNTPHNEKSELARIYPKSAGEWEVIGQTTGGQDQDTTTKPIWQLSRCDALLGNTPFYVNTLKPYVSPPRASKPKTKRLRFEQSPDREAVPEAVKSGPSSPADDRMHGAITQETVDALMGLAMEDEEDTSINNPLSPSASGFIRTNQSISDDEAAAVNSTNEITTHQYQLLARLRGLVDSAEHNPLTIETKDGQKINAHYFMLQLRCPALVKDASNMPETIHLKDYTKSELLAVMSYLYAGDVSFQDEDIPQIEKFAKRYHLKELAEICSKRCSKSHKRIVTPSKGEEQEKDIQDLIQSIWDDNNDQDASSQTGDTSSESMDDPLNPADFTEIYEATSQKSRFADGSSSSDEDDSDNSRMDEMNGEVDSKKGSSDDKDTDGEGDEDGLSGGRKRTHKEDRQDRLQNGVGTGRMVKERQRREGDSGEDGGEGSSRGEDNLERNVPGHFELSGSLEGREGVLEKGWKERCKHMSKGDKVCGAQSGKVVEDHVLRAQREKGITGIAEEEQGAGMTPGNKDMQSSISKIKTGTRLRNKGLDGEDTDEVVDADRAALDVKPPSNMRARRTSDRRQSVESMEMDISSAASFSEDAGTETDSTIEDTPSQVKKRGRPRKKRLSENGIDSPHVRRGISISDMSNNLAGKKTQSDGIIGEKEGSPVFTPRKRGRPPKISGKKGTGVSTSSESDGIDKANVLSPLEGNNHSGSSRTKNDEGGKNFPERENLPLNLYQRKRGRPRKSKVLKKEEVADMTKSSESDSLDQPQLASSVEGSSPLRGQVTRELSPGLTLRKSKRPLKGSSVKKKEEKKKGSESKTLDQAVRSTSLQVSTLSESTSDTEVYVLGNEKGAPTPSRRKQGRPKKNSLVNTTEGRMESFEIDHWNLSQSKTSLRNPENCKGSQDENSRDSINNSFQVFKRKRGRPRKSEGIPKGGKNDVCESVDIDCAAIGDEAISKGEKRSESSLVQNSTHKFPYILQERRWSLRSPQSQEVKQKMLSLEKSESSLSKKKKITPVKMSLTKLATKKKSFKFKRVCSQLSSSKQKDDKIVLGKKKRLSGRSLLKNRKSKDGLSRSNTRSPKNTPTKKSRTESKIVNSDGHSEPKMDDNLDASAALFNEDITGVEDTPTGDNNMNIDVSVITKPANDFFSENYKVSESFKFTASTPNDFQKYKDTISPLKVNLGHKVAVLHMRSVNSSGGEIELVQDMNTSKGKENMPELIDRNLLTPERVDKTLTFDDSGGDDGAVMPVVPPAPIHLSKVPGTNSPPISPVFESNLPHPEQKTSKKELKQSAGECGEEILSQDEENELEEMETNSLQRNDLSPCKSLNGSISFLDGLCIGRGNDEELASRSLSSQPIISLSRRIPDSPVDIRKKLREAFPQETDMKDGGSNQSVGEGEIISVICEEQIQSVGEMSVIEDSNVNNGIEVADIGEEEIEVPQGIDNAEDFAFDLDGEHFVESLHLGPEEEVRTSQGATGVSSPSSFGQPERVSSPSVRENLGESGNEGVMVDSIDLTNDGDEEVTGVARSVVLDEIDLTDNEEIDLTDDEDLPHDVGPAGKPASISATPRIEEVHHSAEVTKGPTSISQELVNGEAHPEEIRILPVIEGCSRSFMEDLVRAPSDEFWSGGELDMAQENCKEPAVPSSQPATQILNARSITLEEFCSPAPITPMPPYDEMITPQLAEELSKYGVKKLKRKKARLKLKELYHFTHQVMQEDESIGDSTDESSKKKHLPEEERAKNKGTKLSEKSSNSKKSSVKPPKESKTGSESSSQYKRNIDPVFAEPREVLNSKSGAKSGAVKTGKAKGDKKRQLKRVTHSEAEKMNTDISSQSSGSDERDDFGESILYDEDPDDITPSQCTSNAEDSVQKYIWNNPVFYQKCLLFQPFDLDEFQAELKANDIKVSKPKLMAILDAKCLTFRHKNRNRRSPKKKKKVP